MVHLVSFAVALSTLCMPRLSVCLQCRRVTAWRMALSLRLSSFYPCTPHAHQHQHQYSTSTAQRNTAQHSTPEPHSLPLTAKCSDSTTLKTPLHRRDQRSLTSAHLSLSRACPSSDRQPSHLSPQLPEPRNSLSICFASTFFYPVFPWPSLGVLAHTDPLRHGMQCKRRADAEERIGQIAISPANHASPRLASPLSPSILPSLSPLPFPPPPGY